MSDKRPTLDPQILVLGALGNVGAEVINSLLALDIPVRAADLSVEKIQARFGTAVQPVHFDFASPETYSTALVGIRKMFLLRPPQIVKVERMIFPALEAAAAAGVEQVVFLSLIGIENNPSVPHYKIEQYLVRSSMKYTFLRASFFMQNLNTTHREEIRARDEIFVPVGNARTSFVDARDLGAAAALALTTSGHDNQAYNLTGGQAFDYYQVAEIFSRVLGRPIHYSNPPAWRYLLRQVMHRKPLAYALVTTWLYTNTRRGMAAEVSPDMQRLLGRPPIRMQQYVEDYRDCWI